MGKYKKEDKNLEFKREYNKRSLKDIDAFLNTDGGKVLFGVDDNGNTYESTDLNELYNQVTNALRDSFSPDPSPFLNTEKKNNEIIEVTVEEGENKPYFITSKGLNSKGVFIREGVATYPATPEEIKRMLRNSDGIRFENLRSINQNLTFNEAKKVFKNHKLPFTSKMQTLGLIQEKTGLYTNLALLLSDQNPYSTKVAFFNDDANTNFIAREEFTGSIFNQLEEVTKHILRMNRFTFDIQGLRRIENYDYPEFSIREAILNSLIHRDYDLGASNIININQKRIEVISLGGIIDGLDVDDILNGISKSRNPNLANIMFRLEFIESYGTGLRRIFNYYSDKTVKPELSVTRNSFKLILPNQNRTDDKQCKPINKQPNNPIEKNIVSYLEKVRDASAVEIQNELGIKRSTSYKWIKSLVESGILKARKEGNKRIYSIAKM